MPDSTATMPGQTAAPTSAGNANPEGGTSGQATTPTEPTSPAAAPAQTSAPVQDVLIAKVRGNEIPVDLRDRQRLQEIVQKGLDYDTAKEKFEERATARAQEILREQAQKQAEDQRLSQLREADPLAYEFENYKKADAEKAQALEQQVTQLRDTLHNLNWSQQMAEAKRQYPDLGQNDWNYAYAQVVANNGRVQLMEAAKFVKEEKDRYEKQVIEGYLQKLKTNAQTAAPSVPPAAGGTPSPNTGGSENLTFANKNGISEAVMNYVKGFQGGS